MKRPTLFLLAILLVALTLRAHAVVSLPFEQDELYTVDESRNLFATRIQPGIQARPLFFLIEHPIVMALPPTPVVLRAIPFLLGVAGVLATWALARSIAGESAALVATFLVAISPWHIGVSSFGRYYSLLYLLAALVYLKLPSAYDTDRPRDYLITLLALLAGAFTHPTFVFPVGAACLVVMAVRNDGTLRWQWPTANGWKFLWVPFLVMSGAIFITIRAFHHSANVANGSWRGLLASLRLLPAIVDGISPVLCVAAAAGVIALLTTRLWNTTQPAQSGRPRFGIIALAAIAATAVALLGLSFYTAIYADYAVAALPLVFVAGAALVQWLQDAAPPVMRTPIAVVMTGVIAAGVLPSTVSFLSDGSRFDYRPAYARIERDAPKVAVLTWPMALQVEYAPQLKAYEIPAPTARLNSILESEGEVWAVISVKRYGIVEDDAGDMARWLGEHCRVIDQYQSPRLDYRMYRVDLWRCHAVKPPA